MNQWMTGLLLCGLTASPALASEEAPRPRIDVEEHVRVGGGIQAGSVVTFEKVAFGEPYLGAVLFGEWRPGFVGISGEGSISRLLGESIYVAEQDTTFILSDLWIFNVGVVARLYPVDWLYAGGGVAVWSSSDSIKDEIDPTLAAGLVLGPVDFGVRYKPEGTQFLEFRLLFTARRR